MAQNRRLIGFLHEVLEVESLDAPVGINPCVDPYWCDHCLGKSEPVTVVRIDWSSTPVKVTLEAVGQDGKIGFLHSVSLDDLRPKAE